MEPIESKWVARRSPSDEEDDNWEIDPATITDADRVLAFAEHMDMAADSDEAEEAIATVTQ